MEIVFIAIHFHAAGCSDQLELMNHNRLRGKEEELTVTISFVIFYNTKRRFRKCQKGRS